MSAQNLQGYGSLAAVTPSDDDADNFASATDALFVGTAGDLEVVTANGETVLLADHPTGWHPIRALRIGASNTAADDIVAAWKGA